MSMKIGVFSVFANGTYSESNLNILFNLKDMAFVPSSGDWTIEKTPTKAATTYTKGMFIVNDATNDVPVTAASQFGLRGIAVESKASSSATTSISLHVPRNASCTFFADTSDTLAATDVGKNFDFSADGLEVTTATTYRPVRLVKFISSTKGEFAFNYTTGIEN